MQRIIRIGTRDSKLAIWQAEFVKQKLEEKWYKCELIFIKSDGDKNMISPLYEMWVEWIFTKTLDIALLNKDIDIAVHSLKDVPTKLPAWIVIAGIPERWSHEDILVYKWDWNLPKNEIPYIVWSSSLRRKAQWLNKFPNHKIEPLRWNIQKRLEKMNENTHWNWAIFAKTAIERLWLNIENQIVLDFMLPAPAQWALALTCLEEEKEVFSICSLLNHYETELSVNCERMFLRLLFWGCSMPIWAYAKVVWNNIKFKGNLLSLDWSEVYETEFEMDKSRYLEIPQIAVNNILSYPWAVELLENLKSLKFK